MYSTPVRSTSMTARSGFVKLSPFPPRPKVSNGGSQRFSPMPAIGATKSMRPPRCFKANWKAETCEAQEVVLHSMGWSVLDLVALLCSFANFRARSMLMSEMQTCQPRERRRDVRARAMPLAPPGEINGRWQRWWAQGERTCDVCCLCLGHFEDLGLEMITGSD